MEADAFIAELWSYAAEVPMSTWFDGIIKHRWTKEQIILGEVQHYLRVRTIRFSSATARSTLSQPRNTRDAGGARKLHGGGRRETHPRRYPCCNSSKPAESPAKRRTMRSPRPARSPRGILNHLFFWTELYRPTREPVNLTSV